MATPQWPNTTNQQTQIMAPPIMMDPWGPPPTVPPIMMDPWGPPPTVHWPTGQQQPGITPGQMIGTAPQVPVPGGGGGGAGGGGGGGAPTFNYPDFGFRYQGPKFVQPEAFSYDPYRAPTLEEVRNMPGYQFRQEQGLQALQNAAAARGVLRSGGTMQDIMRYGQSLADSAYQNVHDRRMAEWQANRANAAENWKMNWQNTMDSAKLQHAMEQDRFSRQYDIWGANYQLADRRFGAEMDAWNQSQANARAAAARRSAAQAANARMQMQQNQANIDNLLSLYQISTQNLPTYTPPTGSNYNTGYSQGAITGRGEAMAAPVNQSTFPWASGPGAYGAAGGTTIYRDPRDYY